MQGKDGWLGRYLRRREQLLAAVCIVLTIGVALDAWVNQSRVTSAGIRPLEGVTVMVDAGHGGYDGGACGASGVWEKEINLAVALAVEEALDGMGAAVVMTRRTDEDFCTENRPANLTKKRQDMIARVDMAKENDVDMVLSIHMNKYRDQSQHGPQVFYRSGCDSGRLLAGCMQESLIEVLKPKKERSALSGDYFILQLDVPSVLVECGFLSNPAEEKKLLDAAYQKQLAEAVAQGVVKYIRLTGMP